MFELERDGALTAGALAQRLNFDRSTISRVVASLAKAGLVQESPSATDLRSKFVSLTERGQDRLGEMHLAIDKQVEGALGSVGEGERQAILDGMRAYSKALSRSGLQAGVKLRPIEQADDPSVARLIRTVLPEFGARGPGYSIADPEVDCMFETYTTPRSAYWVFEREGKVVGGGGFAPLASGPEDVCELRKMYFLPEIRGAGLGRKLLGLSLERAEMAGYKKCYLETLSSMVQARKLYESFGFQPIGAPMGNTGHYNCDAWYVLVF